MAYNKVNWKNGVTPLNDTNLNKMDDQIAILTDMADNTYNKYEVDAELSQKANTDAVYSKEETKTQLGEKANSADVYTKAETNAELSKKVDITSDRIITEDTSALTEGVIYRKDGKLAIATQGYTPASERSVDSLNSEPLKCRFENESELREYMIALGVWTDNEIVLLGTGNINPSGSGYLLRLGYGEVKGSSDYCIEECYQENSPEVTVTGRRALSWLFDDYFSESLYEDIYYEGYSADGILHFTETGAYLFATPGLVLSELVTKEYVDDAITKALAGARAFQAMKAEESEE